MRWVFMCVWGREGVVNISKNLLVLSYKAKSGEYPTSKFPLPSSDHKTPSCDYYYCYNVIIINIDEIIIIVVYIFSIYFIFFYFKYYFIIYYNI